MHPSHSTATPGERLPPAPLSPAVSGPPPAPSAAPLPAADAPPDETDGAGARRFFTDPDSQERWGVVEVDATTTPGARGARCLVFVSAAAVRRVWDYPRGWRALPPAALAALSRHW